MHPTVLETTLYLPDGGTAKLGLKCWPSEDGSALRWELRRLLPAVGYRDRSHRTKCCNVVTQQREKWEDRLSWHGLQNCLGRSRTSEWCRKAWAGREETTVAGEQEYWVDTTGMLSLLSLWTEVRRDGAARSRATAVADCILRACVPPGPALTDDLEVRLEPTPAEKMLCNIGCGDATEECLCCQLQRDRAKTLLEDDGPPQTRAWSVVLDISHGQTCATLGRVAGRLIVRLADLVTLNFDRALAAS